MFISIWLLVIAISTTFPAYEAENWQGFLDMFKGPINVKVNDLIINSDGEIAYSCSVQHVTGTTNEGKPFDSTFRITDVYRKRQGKWVIVQEHISSPPDVARW
jgi:ketosteroid isomerase-like protein